jgi:ribosomal protein S9
MVPGGANESSSAATPSSGGGPQGGLAGALQDALAKRKQKVSGSGKSLLFRYGIFLIDYRRRERRRRRLVNDGQIGHFSNALHRMTRLLCS